jgi:hypothetical protein
MRETTFGGMRSNIQGTLITAGRHAGSRNGHPKLALVHKSTTQRGPVEPQNSRFFVEISLKSI